jgi:hypothetical protein
MRRVLLAGVVLALVGAAVVAIAQPPSPPSTPPATPPTAPPVVVVPQADPKQPTPPRPAPTVPADPPGAGAPAGSDTPLARFEPLAAFPHATQNAVRGVLLGANWMTRTNQAQGRFLFGYNPALRQPLMGDHDLKQARAALALAQAAKFSGDEKYAAVASQAILTLLAATKPDPADPNCRVPVHSSLTCNRVGFAALVVLAIYELPAADAKLVAEAEKLCEFLRKQCRPDGSVHYTDGPTDVPTQLDPEGANEYPGTALHAIAVGNRVRPAAWKAEVATKGVQHYRAKFKANPHPLLAATLTPACAELYLQTKAPDAAAAVFEMNDWLCGMQIAANDQRTPQWAGGFRSVVNGQLADAPPGPETGLYVQSLACACHLTRQAPDLERYAKYRAAVSDAAQYLCTLQYLEANTRHFENTFRANMLIGAFHLSPADGNMRIDATATAITGLLRFLSSGAEK